MDTFALYYCSSVKQKMRPAPGEGSAEYGGEGIPGEADEEMGGGGSFAAEDSFADSFDDDDDI